MIYTDVCKLFGVIFLLVFFLILVIFPDWAFDLIFLVGIISLFILSGLTGKSMCNIYNKTI